MNSFKMTFIFFFILIFMPFSSWANCISTGASQTEDERTALISFGRINLNSTYFFPVGSSLGSVIVPPTNYTYGGATASTILWTCSASDLANIYFMVATNGDDRVGGYFDLGTADGLSNVYATNFAYVGLRQTMSGVVLTRFWQKVPVTTYAVNATDKTKIDIRLQDIPPLQAELFRISSIPPTSGPSNNWSCKIGSKLVYGTTTGTPYLCQQPNSYIQLVGPGLTSDKLGDDSNNHYSFWGVDNGFGYGMRIGNILYDSPTCVARSATPLVLLPTISVTELNSGLSSTANFNITVECSDNVKSGNTANSGQTALGFQVSSGAFSAAKNLGLVNSNNGVSMLLSDNYSAAGMAKGVGINISYSSSPATPLTLIGQQGTDFIDFSGSTAGWYPVLDHAVAIGSSQSGYTNYTYNFTATLKKIDGQTVSAGKVKATATVMVKVQ